MKLTYSIVIAHRHSRPAVTADERLRVDVMRALGEWMKAEGLGQVSAARILGISQPMMSRIVRRDLRTGRASITTLLGLWEDIGGSVTFVLTPPTRARREIQRLDVEPFEHAREVRFARG